MNRRRTARATQDAAEVDDDNVHQQMLPIPRVTRICQRLEMRPERTNIQTQLSHATLPGLLRPSPQSHDQRTHADEFQEREIKPIAIAPARLHYPAMRAGRAFTCFLIALIMSATFSPLLQRLASFPAPAWRPRAGRETTGLRETAPRTASGGSRLVAADRDTVGDPCGRHPA